MSVAAGESVPVSVFIPRDDIAYWDTEFTGWWSNQVPYTVHVGSSSRDIRLSAAVDVGDVVRVPLTLQSTIGEVMADPAAAEGIKPITDAMFGVTGGADAPQNEGEIGGAALGVDMAKMMSSVPIDDSVDFSGLLPGESICRPSSIGPTTPTRLDTD